MIAVLLASLLVLAGLVPALGEGVPIRLSFKFILNAAGNRPPAGDINTDAEVDAQVERGNQIFGRWTSELRFDELEIVDVAGVSQWYPSDTNDRDALRTAATNDPATYHWRNDAINIYITSANDSAISKFPPDNDIVLVCQAIFDTTIAHEVGHSVNLLHTHQPPDDGCTDTLPDDQNWNQDDIANNAYGLPYAQLTAGQQYQVDMVWSNLMSYHNGDVRCMLSSQQMDRQSTQCYEDRNWLLSKVPVYVDSGYGGTHNGSFTQPYQTIQQAINAGILNNKALVPEQGTHEDPASVISTSTEIVTRKGISTIREARLPYSLPYALEESKNPAVREAVVRAQQSDRKGDLAGVIANLQEAEKHAANEEKSAIQLELAQRLRDAQRYEEAAAYFQKAADESAQKGLQERMLKKRDVMKNEAGRARQRQLKKAAEEENR